MRLAQWWQAYKWAWASSGPGQAAERRRLRNEPAGAGCGPADDSGRRRPTVAGRRRCCGPADFSGRRRPAAAARRRCSEPADDSEPGRASIAAAGPRRLPGDAAAGRLTTRTLPQSSIGAASVGPRRRSGSGPECSNRIYGSRPRRAGPPRSRPVQARAGAAARGHCGKFLFSVTVPLGMQPLPAVSGGWVAGGSGLVP